MALEVGASEATSHLYNSLKASRAEDEELYDKLLELRDVIIAGKHPEFKLSESAIAELKASVTSRSIQYDTNPLPQLNGSINGPAFATNQTQLPQSLSFPTFTGLPGLQASSTQFPSGPSPTAVAKTIHATTLDPIFLEKSDSLVRAEGQLKRQRLERDLQSQLDRSKHAPRDKDQTTDAPSHIDVDLVYLSALQRVKPVSGLKEADKLGRAASSSFDENDYYSSQVQSDWSSEGGSSRGSDGAAVAFTADFERLDGDAVASSHYSKHSSSGKALPGSSLAEPAVIDSQDDEYEPGEVFEIEDEDDDYTPPDASAFDSSRNHVSRGDAPMVTPPEDDNSDYEPGEITDSNIATPAQPVLQPAQKSPNVPIVRNHLTHLVAPQPNRVSPLATAKAQTIELELVNGRPEVVQKPAPRSNYPYSRATTASPSGNGVSGSGKKRRTKKRKRDLEPTVRSKRRRERPNPLDEQYDQEPYIKDEPMSPPPFASVPEAPQYSRQYVQRRPADLDLNAARPAPQFQYVPEDSRPGLRYEQPQPASPSVIRVASPAYRHVQRDTQDLRRVATLHHAYQPQSPRTYSPAAPQRTVSMTYGDSRGQSGLRPEANGHAPYANSPAQDPPYYPRAERSRSPPRVQEYRGPYSERVASPALMPPPPPAPARPVVVDQYGNRFYLEEPAPSSAAMPPPRASIAPAERRSHAEMVYEPATNRSSAAYAPYTPADPRMAPPSAPSRRQALPEHQPEYVDAQGYSARGYTLRPAEPTQYAPAPTSPRYQEIRGYEPMPPPPAAAREPTSPVYVSRSYSNRPEEPAQQPASYMRHASVAPTQYVRQDAPPPQMRAMSVMPGLEYKAPAQPQRSYVQAPQNVRYVDQNGNEVFPSQVRQVSEFRYQ